ncbi:MAG: ComF family protein [Negativicutes bacterium]
MSWLQAALQLLFPLQCPGCGREVGSKGAWCAGCVEELWSPRRLDVAGRGMRHVERCQVLTGYRGAVRSLLHGLKFQRRRGNAAPLAWLLSLADEAELADLVSPGDLVIPVPLSTDRLADRGFNQVELLFDEWRQQQGLEWETGALLRRRFTAPQWELDRAERRDNIKGAFFVNAPATVQNRAILLVDDIVTTGRTIEECAVVLHQAGAASVCALALANG